MLRSGDVLITEINLDAGTIAFYVNNSETSRVTFKNVHIESNMQLHIACSVYEKIGENTSVDLEFLPCPPLPIRFSSLPSGLLLLLEKREKLGNFLYKSSEKSPDFLKMHLFKSMLLDSKVSNLATSDGLVSSSRVSRYWLSELQPVVLYSTLMGVRDYRIPLDQYLPLYAFFHSLHMREECFLVCKMFQNNTEIGLKHLLKILIKAMEFFGKQTNKDKETSGGAEGDIDSLFKALEATSPDERDRRVSPRYYSLRSSHVMFESSFTMCVWNMIKREGNLQQILRQKRILEYFEGNCWLSILLRFRHQILEQHPSFVVKMGQLLEYGSSMKKQWFPESFNHVFRNRTSRLYPLQEESKDRKLGQSVSNVTLICAVDGTKFPHCHIEILVGRLNFFAKMIRFPGVEKRTLVESHEIVIENWSPGTIRAILRYAYLGQVSSENFGILFELLELTEMYEEDPVLKRFILKCIESFCRKYSLLKVKRQLSEHFWRLKKEELWEEVMSLCHRICRVGKEKLVRWRLKFIEKRKLQLAQEGLAEALDRLGKQNVALQEEVKVLRLENDSLRRKTVVHARDSSEDGDYQRLNKAEEETLLQTDAVDTSDEN